MPSATVKLNSGMLTTFMKWYVLKETSTTVTLTRYQMSGSTPVMFKLNGASQVRWIIWPRDSVARLLTASSSPAKDEYWSAPIFLYHLNLHSNTYRYIDDLLHITIQFSNFILHQKWYYTGSDIASELALHRKSCCVYWMTAIEDGELARK